MRRGKGIALIVILGITLVLITAVASFMSINLSEINMVKRQNTSTRAFYLSEAGLQDVIYRLKNDSEYRDNPTAMNGSLETGTYSVTISEDSGVYTLISVGSVSGVARTVRQVVTLSPEWPDAFDYSVYGASGELEVEQGATITGNIFQNGDVELKEFSTITGYADATGTIEAGEGATYNTRALPDPLPTFPGLDTSYYNNQVDIAAGSGTGDQTYDNLNLAGGTIYVSGDARINAGGSITGPGTIVSAGDVELKEGVTVGENVSIISGATIEIKQSGVANANSFIYAVEKIELKESGIVMDRSTLLTPGQIEIKEGSIFNGVMYAGGEIEIKQGATITGSVVSGAGVEVKEDVNITFDSAKFPSGIPTGLPSTGAQDATLSEWQEI